MRGKSLKNLNALKTSQAAVKPTRITKKSVVVLTFKYTFKHIKSF